MVVVLLRRWALYTAVSTCVLLALYQLWPAHIPRDVQWHDKQPWKNPNAQDSPGGKQPAKPNPEASAEPVASPTKPVSEASVKPVSEAPVKSVFGAPAQPKPSKSSFDWSKRPIRHPVHSFTPLPSGKPQVLRRIQHDFPSDFIVDPEQLARRAKVKAVFQRCWAAYKSEAWGKDEVYPVSGSFKSSFGGWAATLIDALDTLWIMDLKKEFRDALEVVADIDFGECSLSEVNVFETTIRHLGGLLSAYGLSGEEILLAKAVEVGEMLYAAFDTRNRMPITRWDFEEGKTGAPQEAESTLVAEIGSLTMEFAHLAQITGEMKWYDAVHRVMKVFRNQQDKSELPGMWPLMVDPLEKDFATGSAYTIGAMADSLYEYLPKTYALLGGLQPMYKRMYVRAMSTVVKNTLYRPMNPENLEILMSGMVDSDSKHPLEHSGQHLVCFAGGMFALGGRLFDIEEHVDIGRKITDGCVWAYRASPLGIMPEAFHLVPCESQISCTWNESAWKTAVVSHAELRAKSVDDIIEMERLSPGFAAINDRRYILRPEAIESVFILYRITGNSSLQEDAWDMFTAIQNHTETDMANSALSDVTFPDGKPWQSDSMESFWMAETLKYFYLIFSKPDFISLDDYVFNTEAHPFKIPKRDL